MSLNRRAKRSPLKIAIGIILACLMIGVSGLIGVSVVFLFLAPLFLWAGPTLPFDLTVILITGLAIGLIIGVFWAKAMLKD